MNLKRFGPGAAIIGITASVTVASLLFGPTRLFRRSESSPAAEPLAAIANETGAPVPATATAARTDSAPTAAAQRPSRSAMPRYALDARDPIQFDLSRNLREVSGLALSERGSLFAHQDEVAAVFEIDPATGKRVKSFKVGNPVESGDFEGIATAGRRIFLISSEGTLFEFEEAADDSSASFRRHSLETRERCSEIEGLEYDALSKELWLACKITRGREQRGRLLIFAVPLATLQLQPTPRFSVSLDALAAFGQDAELSPSGLAVHPTTGTLFLVAAQQDVIVEFDRTGQLLGVVRLPRRLHPQPEGIVFAPSGTMFIANEGRTGRANLTVYPMRAAANGAYPE